MIENHLQYTVTKQRLAEFNVAFLMADPSEGTVATAYREGLQSVANDLRQEIEEYEEKLLERITQEPGKRSGQPCVRGMRLTVEDVWGYLKVYHSRKELMDDFPDITDDDIDACIVWKWRHAQKN